MTMLAPPSGQSWSHALTGLLHALGRSAEDVAEAPSQLEEALRGQGLAARHVAVPEGELPDAEMAGALLELADGSWLPLLSTPHGLDMVAADGPFGAAPKHLDHGGRAIVLIPRVDLVRELLPFIRRHKGRLLEILAGGLIVNCLALLFPLFGSFVYDKVLGNGITETLWALAIGLVLAIALDFAVRAVRAVLMERFAVTSEADIDHALFRSLLAGSVVSVPPVGLVLDKYKQILGSRDFLSSAYMLSALDLPFLLLYLAVIASVAGPLVFVPVVVGILTIAGHLLLAIPAHDYERQARHAGEQRFALLADALTAREVIVGARLRDELGRRWHRAASRAGIASGRARYWHSLAQSLSFSSGNVAYLAAVVGGAYMVDNRLLTAGGLMAATMLTTRAMGTLSSVVLLATRYREFRQALNELDTLMPAPPQTEPPRRRGRLPGRLRLIGITTRLRREGRATLQGLDLKIEPGEIIGLAGHPGAGKTTLLRLMAGVLPVDEGQVLIDNLPVDHIAPEDLSDIIGYKPQEPCLLDGTIEDNVRAGNLTANAEQMAEALKASGLAHFFERGELTLATPVGSRGGNLSGGQRQMVALARALLGAPSVLLLDEPNTGLDAPLEAMLADHLAGMREGRSIIISTHSRTLLSICTRIVVIDQGRIITDGPRERVLGA
ncbi:MAG: ATP-binding cassette domain-containing protein [Rhodospirillaceae bacterium]|nr:ATP-binding cassette domain-containing protein [Rhodospirillales bacterium]